MPQKKGCVPWNKGKEVPLTEYQKSIRKSDKEVFTENSSYPRHRLKQRIYKQNLLDITKCDICETSNIWNGKEMPLILDHINGINDDNRIENLRLVCSNCDSQLPTYKSRNRKVGRVVECDRLEIC
jgi:hypothetical protein